MQIMQVADRSTHKALLWVVVVIAILVLAVLILVAIMFWYTNSIKQTVESAASESIKIQPGIWSLFDTEALCGTIITNCVSPNGSTPYGRLLFPFLGDRLIPIKSESPSEQTQKLVGAHRMGMYDAMVGFQQIPVNRVYWAWTGYLYDIPASGPNPPVKNQRLTIAASVGDSVDSGNTYSTSDAPFVVTVLTPNPNMLGIVQQAWRNNQERFLGVSTESNMIQWKLIVIPSNMYNTDYTYCFFTRILQTPFNDSVPPARGWWVSADPKIVALPTLPVENIPQQRSTSPNEFSIYFNNDIKQWYTLAAQTALSAGYAGVVSTYATKTVPYLSWIPSLCQSIQQCGLLCGCQGLLVSENVRFDNNSTIYYACPNITVTKDQALLVVSLNHVNTGAIVAYCNLTFTNLTDETSWLGVITGVNDPLNPAQVDVKIPADSPPLVTTVVQIPDSVFAAGQDTGLVLITERAYINPTNYPNRTGPWYNGIAPFQVFLIPKSSVPPSAFTSNYNWVV